jgi:hypothetical protein
LNNTEQYDRHYCLFKKRQADVRGQIEEKFKEWRKQIKAVEMKIIDQMYQSFSNFEDRFA